MEVANAPTSPRAFEGLNGRWTGDLTWETLPGCLDTVLFNVSVVALDHIWIQFVPLNGSAECPTYIFDSQVLTEADGSETSVGIMRPAPEVFEDPDLVSAFTSGWFMGLITADDVLDAVEMFDGEFGDYYDIITANCAGKVIEVLYYLNLPVEDRGFLDWITARLDTPYVHDLIRLSPNITALYPGLPADTILEKSDSELIGRLVNMTIENEINAYATTLAYFQAKAAAPRAAPAVAPRAAPAAASSGAAPKALGSQPSATVTNTAGLAMAGLISVLLPFAAIFM